jgi:tetraacyldisaccharide 4'-kinase
MFRTRIIQILVFPIAVLYGAAASLRLFLYRMRILRPARFDVPTISIGNMTVGGTGKTPHIEYLIKLLSPYYQVGTLSRGYGRKTHGFMVAQPEHTAEDIGDEPWLFKTKYPHVPVSVGERRDLAIPQLMHAFNDIKTILLDDAFQHLAVQPFINILLTEYDHLFTRDWMFPVGRLREWQSGYRRADAIVVTKCPEVVSETKRQAIVAEIAPFYHQKVYFSYLKYGAPYPLFEKDGRIELSKSLDVIVLCAIARPEYLERYLKTNVKTVQMMDFEDHRSFTNYDIAQTDEAFKHLPSDHKIIITTEKDAARLEKHYPYLIENQLPIYILPIEVHFHFDETASFDAFIKEKLLSFKI